MAQRAIQTRPVESGRILERAQRLESLRLSKDDVAALVALLRHFEVMDTVVSFNIAEDEENGQTIVEVNTNQLQEDEWNAFFHDAWAWWKTQPTEWRAKVHMAIW